MATVKLVPSGETTARGNKLWKLGSVETNVVTETELDETLGERTRYLVTVPSDGTVMPWVATTLQPSARIRHTSPDRVSRPA